MTPKDLNKLDEIYESMNQVYEIAENDLLIHTNLELFKGFRNSNWRDYQLSAKRKEAINNMLIKRGEDLLKGINNSTIKACEIADIPSAKFVKANQKAVNILIKSARTHYSSSVNKVWRLDKTTPLYNRILEQVNKGLDTGLRVQHKNGKSYEFKSYMEMNVRTAVSQEITEKQLELNEVAQNVFWVCNEFQDCAEDHKLLQGKIYYDNRWESFNIPDDVKKQISSFIKRKKLLSFQEVKEKPYWLTTRPNCRHLLTPITIKQAMGDIEQVKKDLKLSTGTYKDIKYKQSQKLRYCERNIRKYKAYVDQYEKIQAQSPNKETQAMIDHYKSMVGKWQANARFVVRDANKDGKWLEREYERETRRTIIKDLGVKYNSRAGKPTPPKTPKEPAPSGKVEPIKTPIKITRDDLPKEFQNIKKFDFVEEVNKIKDADEDAKTLIKNLNKIMPNIKVNAGVSESNYDPTDNGISIMDSTRDLATTFHELGHAIDWNIAAKDGKVDAYRSASNNLNDSNEFKELANDFYRSVKNNADNEKGLNALREKSKGKEESIEQRGNYRNELLEKTNVNDLKKEKDDLVLKVLFGEITKDDMESKTVELDNQIAKINDEIDLKVQEKFEDKDPISNEFSDIIDALSSGKGVDEHIATGHGSKYYKGNDDLKQAEIWANFFSLKVQGNKRDLQRFKDFFPDVYESQEKLLKAMVKKVSK